MSFQILFICQSAISNNENLHFMLTVLFIIWWEFAILADRPIYLGNFKMRICFYVDRPVFILFICQSAISNNENLHFMLTILFIIWWEFAILTDHPIYNFWEFALYVDRPVYNMMRICSFTWLSYLFGKFQNENLLLCWPSSL